MIRSLRLSFICLLALISIACAPVNPNMPREIRYVPEDSCSDALAQAFVIASRGDPGGQYSMGVLWARGCGVPRHYRNAYDWFILSANGGDVRAILRIGDMHRQGEAVEQDPEKAVNWYSLAARMGSTEAGLKLQSMGRKVPYADLAGNLRSSDGDSWIADFARVFLISAAVYYGVRADISPSTAPAQSSPSPSRYRTNCFVNSFGSVVRVDCRTR